MGSLYIEAQGYVPVLLENLYGMSSASVVNLDNLTNILDQFQHES